jgi:hypothetical protein
VARGALADNLNALDALVEKGVVARSEWGVVARERTLTVLPELAEVLPNGGLVRGSVVACGGLAGVALTLALAAGASQQGAWVGVAGLPGLVAAAAVEIGVAPERLVLVNERGRAPGERFGDHTWGEVVAAMIDGFDVVVLGPAATEALRPGTARRLTARLAARGAVLLLAGGAGGAGVVDTAGAAVASGFVADLTVVAAHGRWFGLADGHGVARGRRATVHVAGRRMPRTRAAEMWLPGPHGRVTSVGTHVAAEHVERAERAATAAAERVERAATAAAEHVERAATAAAEHVERTVAERVEREHGEVEDVVVPLRPTG